MDTSPFGLVGKTVLVTGAASGIGREIAKLISAMGGCVIATDRDQSNLEATGLNLAGDGHRLVVADLTVESEMVDLVKACPPLDGVAHSAGIIKLLPAKLYNENRFDLITDNNYKAPVLLNSRLLGQGHLRPGASIVFISSMMSVVGTELNGLYAGTKGALVAMARCLAMELAPKGIRVNCISPGFVITPMMDLIATQVDIAPFELKHPLGLGTPEDVANATVFLLSQGSRWMTGVNLVLDGGYSAQ